jgi:GNAT superfamily N-acetyltransferase
MSNAPASIIATLDTRDERRFDEEPDVVNFALSSALTPDGEFADKKGLKLELVWRGEQLDSNRTDWDGAAALKDGFTHRVTFCARGVADQRPYAILELYSDGTDLPSARKKVIALDIDHRFQRRGIGSQLLARLNALFGVMPDPPYTEAGAAFTQHYLASRPADPDADDMI